MDAALLVEDACATSQCVSCFISLSDGVIHLFRIFHKQTNFSPSNLFSSPVIWKCQGLAACQDNSLLVCSERE